MGGKRTRRLVVLAAACGALVLAGIVACLLRGVQSPVDLNSCLSALTNSSVFAETPLGRAGQVSSYDKTGGNSDWADLHAIRGKDGLYTLADLRGPGCVKRIWMTSITAEEWLFFFDGEGEPRLRFKNDGLFGKAPPFLPPLCDQVSGGSYCYVPLPFARSLRIAVSIPSPRPDMRPYYQIQYEKYRWTTRAVSFPRSLSKEESAAIESVRSCWNEDDSILAGTVARQKGSADITVVPGKKVAWLESEGPATIRSFSIRPSFPPGTSAGTRSISLRAVTLRIFWDGLADPSVETPLGDFFCNGMFPRRFSSMAVGFTGGEYVSLLPMPFKKSVKAELQNDGLAPVRFEVGYDMVPISDGTRPLNYLHASWNSSTASGVPFKLLHAEGRGHYVGCYLMSIGMDGTWTMLEGDDAMWVDGAQSPSLHGTGLEDYFNGGWYYNRLFDLPLHGLIEKAPIRTSQYRFHLPDPVGFRKRLDVEFEFGDGNKARGYLSGVAFWYQSRPSRLWKRLPPVRELLMPTDPLEPASIMGRMFELERAGLYGDAVEQCEYYAWRFGKTQFAPLLKVRAQAYRETVEGYDKVKNELAALAAEYVGTDAGKEAGMLMWFHESDSNALLGIHPIARHRVFLDGQFVGEDDTPVLLRVFPVRVPPGEHEICAEITPARPMGCLSLYLRTHRTNIVTDASWEYSRVKPADWPRTDDPKIEWKPVEDTGNSVPSMAYWQFVPNAFINMQSVNSLARPWGGWQDGKQTAYVRRKFMITEQ